MCAINGILLNKQQDPGLEHKLGRMQAVTIHRGPDGSAQKVFRNVALGANRLAIVAPDDQDILLSNDNRTKFVVFNGEIMNHQELRKKIPASNLGQSDTAIILPMLEKYGQDFIKQLAGMFSIAVYDKEQHSLQLWRDPLGIKPLYYYHSQNRIIFSSEIKAIRAALDKSLPADFAAFDHILRYRFNPGRHTVFPDIKKVLPGETIIFRGGTEIHTQYWSLPDNQSTTSEKVSIEEFRELFSTVIDEHATGDVPGGFFTSGGLDSSLVTTRALDLRDSPYNQPISIKFKPHAVIDETYASHLEKFLGVPFEWVEITDKKARQTLEELIPYLDEPLENPIHVGTYLMAERARERGISSVLTGDGSDEFFLGYERHANWFTHPNPVKNYPKLHWTMKPEEAEELYTKEARGLMREIVDGQGRVLVSFPDMEQALRFERAERLPEYHNMRLDRMTMAHGVEARVPFLDHRIVEYSLKLSREDLHGKAGKEWLQTVAKPWLPKEITNRHKILFPSLPNQWLSGKGADWAADILLNPSAHTSQWIKRDVLERYIREHADNITQRGKLLWALVVLELWISKQESLTIQ